MNFHKLRKREDYTIIGHGTYQGDIWPDSKKIFLIHDEKYTTEISYNTKTFFVHRVKITIYPKSLKHQGYTEDGLSFIWINSESEKIAYNPLFRGYVDENIYKIGEVYKSIKVENEEEMNVVTLKLKYM